MATTKGVSVYLDSGKLASVLSKFTYLGENVIPTEMKALMTGSQVVVNSAKNRCPKRTRTLSKSIHLEPESDQSVVIGTDVHYAKYVEQGTSKMAARPYLRPALESNKKRVQNNVIRAMQQLTSSLGG